MDSETNIQELKDKVRKFCDERDWRQYHSPKELATALIIEAAELLEHFRWKSGDESQALLEDVKKRGQIEDELADIFYCLLRIADKHEIDLTKALNRKMEETAAKYPVEKSKGSAKKYNEF